MRMIVVSDPPPPDFEALMERRRRAGGDRHDEVWEGVLHMAPALHWRHGAVQAMLLALLHPLARAAGLRAVAEINVGEHDVYRVPDGALSEPRRGEAVQRDRAARLRGALPGRCDVGELPFYAAHQVDEVLVIDGDQRSVQWLSLGADGGYQPVQGSGLIDRTVGELAAGIDWPA